MKKSLLVLFTSMMACISFCQKEIEFNTLGFGDIKLGDSIAALQNVIPIKESPLNNFFSFHPGPEYYFVYNGDIKLNDSVRAGVVHILMSVSSCKIVNQIIVFLSDNEGMVPRIIKKINGRDGWGAIADVNNKHAGTITTRITSEGAIISLFEADDERMFPAGTNCRIVFRKLHEDEASGKYSISLLH